ncbi:Bifunctional transcriptional activator/DNA repair enzyme Ada [Tepidimonas thermarum]|uniref:methylated-DNA--[protein]-cysteine S-methyltransferase n=1 Tax=Tepidimonas thermarum TaxID=335431 RepID=A0A554X0G2_9BURK|nr:methylated-DNA--[protein]-cysteine S-methyltransferase [Tepidimonas thermarum]TSE29310.1 Bifunctional transcriptional activator/DNA repair enzyme Ada [Tepidimonas thermarum]
METLHTAVAPSALGWVLVAATPRGLCALLLGDDVAPLQADLRRRWPGATLAAGNAQVQAWARQAADLVAAPQRPWALPLDIRGTPFQQRVWALLRTIPPGQTVCYGALAARLGKPRAARAVAQACAANPLAVIVPCHRVVASDGGLGGYRWGLARKRALLALEAAA